MDRKLINWASHQRRARKEGRLSQEQIDLLDAIGFDWEEKIFVSLAEANPELASEWHPTKNGSLSPSDVTAGSGKKVWWRCKEGHEWEATINKRSNGAGCPYCAGQRVHPGANDLATMNPKLALEWHQTRNGALTPSDVTAGSGKKVWWRCAKGHEWQAMINNRSSGKGCPYCAKQKTKRRMNMIELFEHNRVALAELVKTLRGTKRTSIIQPTGTGKSYVALGYIERRPELHVAYLSPSTRIFDQVSNIAKDELEILENVEFISYQKLQRKTKEEITGLHFDVIILDEYHRCGAKLWQIAIRTLIEANPHAILIGLSATPIRYLDSAGIRDMTKELFHSSVAHLYPLDQAIRDGNLPKALYVLGDIEQKDILVAAEARMKELKEEGLSASFASTLAECVEEMRRNIQDADGVIDIFDKYLPENAKLIVFCRNYAHLHDVHNSMKTWMRGAKINSYICKAMDMDYDADEQLAAFRDDKTPCVRILYTVDMLNEGVHIDDLTGVVMLRPTSSPNVYLQQIGRCLASGKNAVQPIIFDLVNNFQKAKVKGSKTPALQEVLSEPDEAWGLGNFDFSLLNFRVNEQVVKFHDVAQRFTSMTENLRETKWMEMYQRLKAEYEKGNRAEE